MALSFNSILISSGVALKASTALVVAAAGRILISVSSAPKRILSFSILTSPTTGTEVDTTESSLTRRTGRSPLSSTVTRTIIGIAEPETAPAEPLSVTETPTGIGTTPGAGGRTSAVTLG